MAEIALHCGKWRAIVRPELGGALTHCEIERNGGWLPLLRSTSTEAGDVLETACFPVAPFFGRLRGGRFVFRGREVVLPPIGPHPTPLHGFVWRTPWQVDTSTDAALTLACAHHADAWPWPFTATQTFELDDDGLTISLVVRNSGHEAMPCGIGLHPCFPCDAATRLFADVEAEVALDSGVLPIDPAPTGRVAITEDMQLDRRTLHRSGMDCSFDGWVGTAVIEQPSLGYRLRLTASPAISRLHVYAPSDDDCFCVEPVGHAIDAFNLDEADLAMAGVQVLAPGESQQMQMRLSLDP